MTPDTPHPLLQFAAQVDQMRAHFDQLCATAAAQPQGSHSQATAAAAVDVWQTLCDTVTVDTPATQQLLTQQLLTLCDTVAATLDTPAAVEVTQ